MVFVGILVLNRLMGIIHTLKPKNFSDAYHFKHSVARLKMLMFESFGCTKFLTLWLWTLSVKIWRFIKSRATIDPKYAKLRQVKI